MLAQNFSRFEQDITTLVVQKNLRGVPGWGSTAGLSRSLVAGLTGSSVIGGGAVR